MLCPVCKDTASSSRGEKVTASRARVQKLGAEQNEEAQVQTKQAGRAVEGGHAPCSQQGPDVPIMGSQQLVCSLQVLQGQKCPRPWDMQGMAPPTATHRLRALVGAAWGLAPTHHISCHRSAHVTKCWSQHLPQFQPQKGFSGHGRAPAVPSPVLPTVSLPGFFDRYQRSQRMPQLEPQGPPHKIYFVTPRRSHCRDRHF